MHYRGASADETVTWLESVQPMLCVGFVPSQSRVGFAA